MDLYSRIEAAAPDEVLTELHPALPRRMAGVGALGGLGALMVWLGFGGNGNVLAQATLVVAGIAALYFSTRLWVGTHRALELTPTELREQGGRRLCLVDEIEKVDRGFSAMKPTHGFVLRTKNSQTKAAAPGLWWRFGTWIGVGGVTNAGQGKAMAEALALLVAKRDDG